MIVFWCKIAAMLVLGLASLILGLLPFKPSASMKKHMFVKNAVISALLCFGFGVFITACFSFILLEDISKPEAEEAKNQQRKMIGEIIFCAGFFIFNVLKYVFLRQLHVAH